MPRSKNTYQIDITPRLIQRAKDLRAQGLTLGEISIHPDINWPLCLSLDRLGQIAGPPPRGRFGDPCSLHEPQRQRMEPGALRGRWR